MGIINYVVVFVFNLCIGWIKCLEEFWDLRLKGYFGVLGSILVLEGYFSEKIIFIGWYDIFFRELCVIVLLE